MTQNRTDSALDRAIDQLADAHEHGHRCPAITDAPAWRWPAVGNHCPITTLVADARAEAALLRSQVHDAAHNDDTVTLVAEAMLAGPLDDLPPEPREGWLMMARFAIEGLAAHLDPEVES